VLYEESDPEDILRIVTVADLIAKVSRTYDSFVVRRMGKGAIAGMHGSTASFHTRRACSLPALPQLALHISLLRYLDAN